MEIQILSVTKIEAVRQQIDEAIWMFFNRRNPIAIHSIVGAAHQTLHDITGRSSSMIKNETAAMDSGKDWYRRLNKEYNFFKHGKGDAGESLTFDPLLHTYYLLDCVYMYRELTGERYHNHNIFDVWFALANPNTVGDQGVREFARQVAQTDMKPNDYEYFAGLLEER